MKWSSVRDLCLVLAGFVSALAIPLAAQPRYVVTDLGTLGGANTFTHAINNAGQVAGDSSLANGDARGFRTAPNSPINPATDVVPPLGGSFVTSTASGINNLGQVTGLSATVTFSSHAFRLDADGTIHDLGDLGGTFHTSNGNAINDSGQVTGASWAQTPPCGISGSHAFRTAPNSAITPADNLGTLLNGCRSSVGFGINSSGQVVGYSAFGNFLNPVQHAMLANPSSSMVDLGVLGGVVRDPPVSGINAIANGINSSGQIVGSSTYDGAPHYYATHAFLTTEAGPMSDLGTLGGAFSQAFGINTSGDIVGSATTTGDVANHGFLYTGGVMNDLNDLIASGSGWEIISASAINDGGQIAGEGKSGGTFHAVRLDPADVAVTILNTLLSDPSLGLTGGQTTSLGAKLQAAVASIQQGLNQQAINQLNAFLNEVQALAKTGHISAAAAATLTAAADAIIATLS